MRRLLAPVLLLLLAGCLLAAAGASAQVETRTQVSAAPAPATIKGRIFDAESGESMPYTNVFIAGTNIGTMAFTDGFYIIRGLQPGTYTVKASYISYAVGSETVTVGPGEVLNLDFHLDVQAIMVEPLEIAAERALVEVERTGSSHYISGEEMEAMPLDQVVDMIAMQPGVTLQDNEIHIRGGRADDTQFVVDGMSVNDPLAGGGYGYNIDPSLINEIEILTGGFNAEYGQAVSGVVKVTTKEGSDRVEGRVSFKRDYLFQTADKRTEPHWRNLTDYTDPQNIDIIKASLSGPDPISAGLRALGLRLPGHQYFIASASLDTRDGYLPIYSRHNRLESPLYKDRFWSPRQQNNWNGLAKWTWHFTPRHKLNINLSRQVAISQGFGLPGEGYPRPFMDNLDNYLTFTNENILSQVYYRQVLSDTDWFEITAGRNFSRMHANVNGSDDYTTYEPRDYDSNDPTGQATGSADRWHDHYTESWTLKGAYSFMGAGGNKLKTGFDLSYTEMQLIDLKTGLGDPPAGRLANTEDIFRAHPITAAAYFQDTYEYRGLIINAGLRTDLWAPGSEVERVMENNQDYLFVDEGMAADFQDKTFGLLGRRWKMRLSPRIGLSFPVTERDKFFFNYGHFSQWPRFAYVYPQLEAQTTSDDVQLLGNPNLDPKVTVEYETGIQHEFSGLWSLGLTFYNRDIYGYAKSVQLDQFTIDANQTPDPNDSGSKDISPVRYFNGDSARSLGVEISVIKRTTKWLSGTANVELQRSTGTNSTADEAYLDAVFGSGTDTQNPNIGGLTRNPLLWDKPWTVSLNLDFTVDEHRPELFGWRMPANWSANLLVRAESGQRYTPKTWENDQAVDGPRYSKLGPYRSTINLRLNKFWKFGATQRLTVYLEVRNLLNHKDYRRVNPYTGDGYQLGDYNPDWDQSWSDEGITTDSEGYAKSVVNPSYIENPRILLWGVSYSW